MSKEYQHILNAALSLESTEKFSLVQALLEEMKGEIENENTISPLQIEELEKRMKAFQNGKMKIIPGKDAMQKLRLASEE